VINEMTVHQRVISYIIPCSVHFKQYKSMDQKVELPLTAHWAPRAWLMKPSGVLITLPVFLSLLTTPFSPLPMLILSWENVSFKLAIHTEGFHLTENATGDLEVDQ